MTTLLWRIEGASVEPNLARWQQGLTLHLLFQPLSLIVARRDGQTRHYLALRGCPQCRADGCDRVCHRMLFEQLVRTSLPGVTLIPTPRLLPRPGETRRLLATPRRTDARPLDAAFLEQWDEGRLITTWSRLQAKPQPVSVGALLAVEPEGPDPRAALRSCGWAASRVRALFSRAAFAQAMPGSVPIARRAGEPLLHALRDPQLLIGAACAELTRAESPALCEEGEVVAYTRHDSPLERSSEEA
ncbi:MAG: hypothetical protein HGA45_41225 [Chloroflexales bacterium]|nr:hypothetical protein [Chloroflexales bacterium]